MLLENIVNIISENMWNWPLPFIYAIVGIYVTLKLNFLQITQLLNSFKLVIFPDKSTNENSEMSPFQAFINALGTGTGNGSIAGMATAVAVGGPGAAFWILVAGVIALVLRFAEVYLATFVIGKNTYKGYNGGPLVYLSMIPGGRFLPYLFTAFMLLYGLSSGNAMQANAIGSVISGTWNINTIIIASILGAFIAYIIWGGASRVLKLSDTLVPLKVGVFLISSFIVLIYHYKSLPQAIALIFANAFSTCAISGAAAGITVQQAIKNGLTRSLNANEAGLGSAAFLFGASGTKNPIKTSIMSMSSVFICTYLVSFVVALCVIVSGVWNNGLQSIPLTVSAFNTVFGTYGGWVVTFCSASFGLGCMVSFYLISRECWEFLTNKRFIPIFNVLYCAIAFFGTLAKIDLIWSLNDIVNGVMLLINLYAIVYFLPKIRRAFIDYQTNEK